MSAIPDGTPVVLLNAFPVSRLQWDRLLAVWARDGLPRGDVITFDMPGIGEMPLTDEEPSLELIADAAVPAMREVTGRDAAIWIGCSMGGYVAMAVAERHPDAVAGLGLICTKAAADDEEARDRRLSLAAAVEGTSGLPDPRATADGMVGAGASGRDELVSWIGANIAGHHGDAIAWGQRAMAARPDRTEVLRAIDGPVVVVLGGVDTIVRRDAGEAMAAAADVVPVVLDGVGHLAAIEAPAATADALTPLLEV